MSKLELKSAFIIGNPDSTKLMRNFLIKEMKIEIVERTYYSRDVIDVPQKDYEKALIEGREYVAKQQIQNVSWVNPYNVAIECGYLQLAYAILRRKRKGTPMWCLDKYLPEDILEYLKKMREYLGVNVQHSYHEGDRALCFAPQSLDYEKQLELMKNFVVNEGTGPFSRIIPVSHMGELQKDESFFLLKVKK